MKIRELERWLTELRNLNLRNKRLQEEIDNLHLLLIPPYRRDNIAKIEEGLNHIIEIADPYLPKENLLALSEMKQPFEKVLYPENVTAGMMLENIRKDEWKEEINNEKKMELKTAIENHKVKLNGIFSRYNPFLKSPAAKIQALEVLEDYLNRPQELAPNAQSIHELIEAWKSASLPPKDELIEKDENHSPKESESFAVIIGKHRNIFFNETRNINTSTQDFLDSIDKDYGSTVLVSGLQ
ncbi:hypothetical protein Lnau_0845 [Legionella nautarum]|uniref:Uncharacterized protein n=1 Tax=Legionella nautarum TaxID=45070 RepID=A0A0W0WU82_9GAMM|nr:hypothetical protein [Legionella nautarum]KTD35861.1 hypothetical protein Lnau_0845 [Legionella nautarum]